MNGIISEWGRKKFVSKGFTYEFESGDGIIEYWRCELRPKCVAGIYVKNSSVIREIRCHRHEPSYSIRQILISPAMNASKQWLIQMYLNGDPLSPCGTANSSVTNSPLNTDSDGGQTNCSALSTFDYDSNLNDTLADAVSQTATVVLTRESSTAEMQYWLRCNRFGSYINRFENYTVADMLSLSRDDFIQICGIPDGIRLFNTLPIVSKLTMYISTDSSTNIYHPIYLKSLTCQELINRVAPLTGSLPSQICSGFVLGPHNSQIIITDDLVRNIKEETLFFVELCKETGGIPRNKLFLKPMSPTGSILTH